MTLDDIKKFAKENRVKLQLSTEEDCIWLNTIKVELKRQRGKGLGGKIIRMLQEYAKSQNKTIKLLASDIYCTDLDKLFAIYSHLGFKHYDNPEDIKCNDYMIWGV